MKKINLTKIGKYSFCLLLIVSASILLLSCASSKNVKLDAYQLYHSGQYEEAVKVARLDLKDGNNPIDNYCIICWSLLNLERYEDAESVAAEGLSLYPYGENYNYDYRLVQILDDARNHRPSTNIYDYAQSSAEYYTTDKFQTALLNYLEYTGKQGKTDELLKETKGMNVWKSEDE